MSQEGALPRAGRAAAQATMWTWTHVRGQVVKRVGGPARARVITLFGAVLALSGADAATVGAVAPQLEQDLHIGNTEIGLLSSVALLIGALFTIPIGLYVDRFRRMPMLALSIVLWSVASLLSAFAGSYGSLLLTRLFLGAVTATAGPAIASLIGDYFPARERGRVWAYVLGGEIAGTAVGFIISGSVASLIDWRAAFVLLGIPGFFLARELYRTVPEPQRGGQSHLAVGAVDFAPTVAAEETWLKEEDEEALRADEAVHEAIRKRGVQPDPDRVVPDEGRSLGLVASVRYILSVPTNMLMIISSALGYFFFAGLSTFALLFVRGHYHASQAEAQLVLGGLVAGAMIGTLVSGRVTDALVHRGMLEVRIWIPALCYLGAAVLLVAGIASGDLGSAIWFDIGGAALLSAANPPLDAARLDIMPSGLWGRAESTRTVLRSLAQAIAPVVFGGLADLIAGIAPKQAPIGTHPVISPGSARGLQITFLVLLGTLVAAGIVLLRARTTYARDTATAAATHVTAEASGATATPQQR
jgi:MFS family permease